MKGNRLNLFETGALTFEPPDWEAFPCLSLAVAAGRRGGTAPAVLNGANEKAVELFLRGKINFMKIPYSIKEALQKRAVKENPTLDDILQADAWARAFVEDSVL
jgi:1-deoxy-D-xylulose-5-phosphate reductoisomerase